MTRKLLDPDSQCPEHGCPRWQCAEGTHTHGGRRPGAGRRPEADAPRAHIARIPLSPAERAELTAAAGDVPLATWIRLAALAAARLT